MIRYTFFCICLFIFSCNNQEKRENREEIISTDTKTAYTPKDMYTWSVDIESMAKIKNPAARPEYLHTDSLIKGLNASFPEIQLKKLKQGHDTLYVKIDDATYLTQQMGSTGPNIYMATVFFNLTSIPGINYVNIDFKPGDHAEPDVLRPEIFKEYQAR